MAYAFLTGLWDRLRQPGDSWIGVTYGTPTSTRSRAYDRGANLADWLLTKGVR